MILGEESILFHEGDRNSNLYVFVVSKNALTG